MPGFHHEKPDMTRVDIATGMAFDEFVPALEKAVPLFDRATMQRIVAQGGNRDDVRAAVTKNAPNELSCWESPDTAPGDRVSDRQSRDSRDHVSPRPQGFVVCTAADAGLQRCRGQRDLHHGAAQRCLRQPRYRRGDQSR